MRAAIPFLLFILAGCASRQGEKTAAALERAAEAAEMETEAALIAQFNGAVQRRGNVLRVASRGGFLEYVDTDCAHDTNCSVYRLDAVLLGGRLLGIAVGHYEGDDYIVADTQSGHLFTGEAPLLSPSGHMFATAAFDEAYPTSAEGVRLYALDFPMRQVRAISPDVLRYPSDLVWRGDRCFQFTAVEGDPYNERGEENPRLTWHLVEASPEWRLTREREPLCQDNARPLDAAQGGS